MQRVACFGEMMVRISPDDHGQWLQNSRVPVYIGGAELNTASALAAWKHPVRYITAMPANAIAMQMEEAVKQRGVDLHVEQVAGSRIGVYYLIQGAELKGAGVTYDRELSAFSQLKPGMIDWQSAFSGCTWLHLSAINPALNDVQPLVCLEALKAARAMGLTVSIDLNHRPKLWQYGKKPVQVMPELVQYADIILGNMWSVEQLLGIPAGIESSTGITDETLAEAARNNAAAVLKAYPLAKRAVYTFRLADRYFALSASAAGSVVSRTFPLTQVVDRAGSGDCFMAGIIYGIMNGMEEKVQVDLAAAAAVYKMTEQGDHTLSQIERLIKQVST